MKHQDDAAVDALFDAARAAPPAVPQALMDRVLADAQAAQPQAARKRSLWAAFVQATGGAPGLCGLATAACVGVWIGVAPPDVLPDLGGIMLGVETLTEAEADTSGFGWDIEEG